MTEVWKDIEGYEGKYQVSNLGRVKSVRKQAIINPIVTKVGYERVDLWNHCQRNQQSVHRLVAKAFIPNPDNKSVVNHIDENKRNNSAGNLEWVTESENARYGTAITRRNQTEGYKNRHFDSETMAMINAIPILQYTKDGQLVREWESASECSRQTGITISNIREVCRGNRKTAKGFIFKNKEEI